MSYQDIYYQSDDGLKLYARDYPHDAPKATVLCMHGMSRNSADFHDLAQALQNDFRVVSVDQRGRGLSDYDSDPYRYNALTYSNDMLTLLDHLGLKQVIAIGTSMGGIISLVMGAKAPERLQAVILNDIGPVIERAGLDRIKGYVGKISGVESWADAAAQVRSVNEGALPHYDDDDWRRFAERVFRENENGVPVQAYDPAIAAAFQGGNAAPDLWPAFDAIASLPVLVVRGETSDILSMDCVDEMQRRKAGLISVTVPGVGHAPMLDEPEARSAVLEFLQALAT
ncbi:MAG: alpha/beta hydrolase [Pseudomonadota bacterium]